MAKSKKFWRKKCFWSESIQIILKRISKRKSRNRKFFPLQFFLGLSHFCHLCGQFFENLKNFEVPHYLVEKISSKFNAKFIEMIPVKFSTTLFFVPTLQIFSFFLFFISVEVLRFFWVPLYGGRKFPPPNSIFSKQQWSPSNSVQLLFFRPDTSNFFVFFSFFISVDSSSKTWKFLEVPLNGGSKILHSELNLKYVETSPRSWRVIT